MLDGISQSLVNMANKVGKGDLDKGVVFDTQTGKFAVNRNADQMGLGDHNFFQNEAPTELGAERHHQGRARELPQEDSLRRRRIDRPGPAEGP